MPEEERPGIVEEIQDTGILKADPQKRIDRRQDRPAQLNSSQAARTRRPDVRPKPRDPCGEAGLQEYAELVEPHRYHGEQPHCHHVILSLKMWTK